MARLGQQLLLGRRVDRVGRQGVQVDQVGHRGVREERDLRVVQGDLRGDRVVPNREEVLEELGAYLQVVEAKVHSCLEEEVNLEVHLVEVAA